MQNNISPTEQIDLSQLKTESLFDRPSKVKVSDLGKICQPNQSIAEFLQSLPNQFAACELHRLAELIVNCYQNKRIIAAAIGIQKSIRERIHYLLQKVGGLKLLHRPVNHISGGELQRVLLALALDPQPELLLLDEPAAGVDFSDQENFYGLLSHLNRDSGLTRLLVSHDLSIVSKHAHHVLCLKNGIIECQGAPESILSKEMLSRTFGGEMTIYQHDHPSSHPAHFHPPHDHSHSHNHSHSHHHSHSHNPSHPHSSTHESSEDSNQSDDATNHSKQDHRHDDQPINPDHAN